MEFVLLLECVLVVQISWVLGVLNLPRVPMGVPQMAIAPAASTESIACATQGGREVTAAQGCAPTTATDMVRAVSSCRLVMELARVKLDGRD